MSWLDSCFPSLCAPELLHWLIIQQRLALLLRGCLGPDVLGVAGLWGCCCSCPCSALPVLAVKLSRGAGTAVLLWGRYRVLGGTNEKDRPAEHLASPRASGSCRPSTRPLA